MLLAFSSATLTGSCCSGSSTFSLGGAAGVSFTGSFFGDSFGASFGRCFLTREGDRLTLLRLLLEALLLRDELDLDDPEELELLLLLRLRLLLELLLLLQRKREKG